MTNVGKYSYEVKDASGNLIGVMVRFDDALFFVEATHDIPALLAEVRRLREENERLRSFRVVIGTIREATPSAGEVDDAEDMD